MNHLERITSVLALALLLVLGSCQGTSNTQACGDECSQTAGTSSCCSASADGTKAAESCGGCSAETAAPVSGKVEKGGSKEESCGSCAEGGSCCAEGEEKK